jgi:hypothetical protein
MKEPNEKQKQFMAAVEFVSGQIAQGKKINDKIYPLNRGDIIYLVMLIENEMKTDPSLLKRFTAMREKLGHMAFDAPQMSKEESQQFRD